MQLRALCIYLPLLSMLVEPANAGLPACISDIQIYTDQIALDPIRDSSRRSSVNWPPKTTQNFH